MEPPQEQDHLSAAQLGMTIEEFGTQLVPLAFRRRLGAQLDNVSARQALARLCRQALLLGVRIAHPAGLAKEGPFKEPPVTLFFEPPAPHRVRVEHPVRHDQVRNIGVQALAGRGEAGKCPECVDVHDVRVAYCLADPLLEGATVAERVAAGRGENFDLVRKVFGRVPRGVAVGIEICRQHADVVAARDELAREPIDDDRRPAGSGVHVRDDVDDLHTGLCNFCPVRCYR
jgi:hypothetical protein